MLASRSLDETATKMSSLPDHPHVVLCPPTWAGIAATNRPSAPPQIPAGFNPDLSTQHTRLQQRLLRDAKTVLVEVELGDPSAPQDRSPHGNHKLCMRVNKHLAKVDKAMSDLMAGDELLTPSLTEPT
ncbi:hypothetical protein C0993_005773 [Termitomyces sp. T159_Od127]|nr:hypothetical protein C0993_005773 [Termitomyces sp. T159_Od127]